LVPDGGLFAISEKSICEPQNGKYALLLQILELLLQSIFIVVVEDQMFLEM